VSHAHFSTVNLGKSRSGLSGSVGYKILDETGGEVQARTMTGVFELTASSGMYGAFVVFPNDLRGSIVWDSGPADSSLVYAVEEYNYTQVGQNSDQILTSSVAASGSTQSIELMLTQVSASVDFIRHIEGGRWKIDTSTNQMTFYKDDNVTVVAVFDLKDSSGSPTSDAPFERVRS